MRFILIFFINIVIVKSDSFFYKHELRNIGEVCVTANSKETGTCRLACDCSALRNPFYQPSFCGYYDLTPVVCCPTRRIGDSCFNQIKNEYGICKLKGDCKQFQGDNSQKQFELCGYVNNIPVVCCSEPTQPVLVSEEIVDKQQANQLVGESCIVNTTSENGLCKLVEDCEQLLDAKSNLCGTWNLKSVVCCPNKKEIVKQGKAKKIPVFRANADYEKLPKECIVTRTGEKGTHKMLEHCPAIQQEIKDGIEQPIICEEDFCRDIVCCPIDKSSTRKRLICSELDDPIKVISRRLTHNKLSCIIKDTSKNGTITSNLDCAYFDFKNKKNNAKLCKFGFCEYNTCCEKPKDVCKYNDRKYNFVRMVGDSCTDLHTGLPGICTIVQQCLEVTKRNNSTMMTICGYDCCTPIVCCPERKIGTSGSMCSTYRESLYTKTERFANILPSEDPSKRCNKALDAAVSFGVAALTREFPFMAALGYEKSGQPIKWLCGGTLISKQFVMTAGHCATSPDYGPVKYVRLGILDLTITELGDDCPEEYLVSEIITHPSYNVSSRYNDIALLRLSSNVIFSPYIIPACLPLDSEIPQKLTAMGWGATGYAAPSNDRLTKVDLTFYDHKECSDAYREGETGRLAFGIMEETQMCAGSRTDGQDTCVGDSGGPIQANHNYFFGTSTVYGITSFGRACGFKNSPAVYTRVFPYVTWIESIIWQ